MKAMKLECNYEILTVFMLGLSFMLIFTSFQTVGLIEKVILDSVKKEDPTFNADGFISLAIIYIVFALSNWISPSCIAVLGSKYVMLLGGFPYILFVAVFLNPQTWSLYVASVILGLGAPLLWTGEGHFMTLISTKDKMSRNSGIFWAMLQCSCLFGNLLVFFKFSGVTYIDKSMQFNLFVVLLIPACLGWLCLLILHHPSASTSQVLTRGALLYAFKKSWKLACTPHLLSLLMTFFYTGIELSFISGVYTGCIGFTEALKDQANSLMGLSGICIGLGGIFGGFLFGIIGSKTNKCGKHLIILLGYAVHIITFFLIYLNLPNNSPFGHTNVISYIYPSSIVILACAFLLGFGDACYNTQIYSMLGSVYSQNSASAFTIYKFSQSTGASLAFFYSSYVGLHYQLLILFIVASFGTLGFCKAELSFKQNTEELYEKRSSEVNNE